MCGIVGLFLRDPRLEPELGALLATMLTALSDRGPDSAGFAVYSSGQPGRVKLTLRDPAAGDFAATAAELSRRFNAELPIAIRDTHAVLSVPAALEAAVRSALAENANPVDIVSSGARMEVYKEVGRPPEVATRFDLMSMGGTHGIGHTRMATESAVTTEGAHPFTTGPDQCLVHNGSLSNHNGVRRMLQGEGLTFSTDNDSEVAAGYLTWQMREGRALVGALEHALDDLDGFYTFVVGTESGFAVLRDPIACKPAIMAQTDDYVAFGSEYRALADLPGIALAHIWEPEPATVYSWERTP